MLPMEAPVRNSNSLLQVPPPMAETYTSPRQGIVGHLVEERRRGVCSLKAGVFGEIGERLVHDGDDVGSVVGECFGLFRCCIASGGRR